MGIFDLFGRKPKTESGRTGMTDTTRDFAFPENNIAEEKKAPLSVIVPHTSEDIERVIDVLKTGKTTIVHLTNLKPETQLRVLDMLSGAIYALNGGVYEMEKNVFMFSPSGVEIL